MSRKSVSAIIVVLVAVAVVSGVILANRHGASGAAQAGSPAAEPSATALLASDATASAAAPAAADASAAATTPTAAGAGTAALAYLKARERWILASPPIRTVGWNEPGPLVGDWFVPGSADAMREWFVLLGKWEQAGLWHVSYSSVENLHVALQYAGLREGGSEALVIGRVSADIGARPLGKGDMWGESEDTLHRLTLIWMGNAWRVDSDSYVDANTVRDLRTAGAPAAMIEAARRQLALAGYGAKGPAQALATVRRFFALTAQHRYAAAQRLVATNGTWRAREFGENVGGLRYLSAEFLKGTRDEVLLYVRYWAASVKVRAGSEAPGENGLFFYLVRNAKTGGWQLLTGGSGP